MNQFVFSEYPERYDVDKAVVVIAFVKIDIAGNVRHANRVAVPRDAGDHAVGNPSGSVVMRIYECMPISKSFESTNISLSLYLLISMIRHIGIHPRIRIADTAEAQCIRNRNHFRAHARDIADIADNAGCRAFVWHDLGRMIVGFVAHDNAIAMAVRVARDFGNARVFGGSKHDIRSFSYELLEMRTTAFVRAVF